MPNDLSPLRSEPLAATADAGISVPKSVKGDDSFYADLPAFEDFAGFTDASRYQALPDGWTVVMTDIRGSTKAIGEGRYKDVNMMGAACITAVLNAIKGFERTPEIPYVFGGDGATLAVPTYTIGAVRQALIRTRALCRVQFGLDMRIGIVPVGDVRAGGRDILVAKFQLSPGNHLAMFSGGGFELVDSMVKDEAGGAIYRVEGGDADGAPDLEGLSCRWTPIHTMNGRIVSLLIRAPSVDSEERTRVYRKLARRVTVALRQNLNELSPVSDKRFKFAWPPKTAVLEARATAKGAGRLAFLQRLSFILLQSALQYVLHRFDGKAGAYHAPSYKLEMIANTDFRRFDDVLRLVIDCSEAQMAALETCLAELRAEEGIAYGMHAADTALMTCLVFSIEESEHVHFVDGGDGGYAMAARQLKAQLAEDKLKPRPDVWEAGGNAIRARKDRAIARTETRRKAARS